MISPADFVKLLLDPLRIAVLGRAAEGRLDIDEVAGAMHADKRTVLEALGRLRAAELIDGDELDRATLRALAAALPQVAPADPGIVGHGWTGEEALVLSRFFVGDRLASIPSNRSKRLVVLERLAQEFEPGRRYSEPEVNFALQMFHADYAALRRYLVDEGLMTRADGVYWRTGGRYEPLGADE